MTRALILASLVAFIAPLSSTAWAADAAHGKAVFARCAICHKVEKGAGNGLGPNLFGVTGHKAGMVKDFSYSGPFKKAAPVWTNANLDKWLTSPARMVPGTKMAFPGITSKTDRADVIAYLTTLK